MFQCDGRKLRLLASVMTAALLGACSSDVTRFGDDPFQNPFRSRTSFDPVTTSSVNRPVTGAPQPPRPLAAVRNDAVTTQALPAPNAPIMGGNPARTSGASLTTGSVASANYPRLAAAPTSMASPLNSSNGWSAVGGTPVTLQQGENIHTLSGRYNVPVSAIMAVNGFSNANQAQAGQQIMIPAYNAVAAQRTASAGTAGSVIQRAPAQPLPAATVQSAAPVPPRAVLSQAAPVPAKVAPAARQVAPLAESEAEKRAAAKLKELKAPKIAPSSRDDDEDDDKPAAAPNKRADAARKAEEARQAEAKAKLEAEKRAAAKLAATKAATAKKAREDEGLTTASITEKTAPKTQPLPAKSEPIKAEPEKTAAVTPPAAAPAENTEAGNFRWPAKGRVISGYGARGTGGANDGINIALPEGTPVRAAEGGTVVHADDALKGYGKLVLIRHANGYVSVYAHNGELNVKRGESVKRGQVIAKSGQSGNVTAPQLHFEIRKGATPVDPTKYLGE